MIDSKASKHFLDLAESEGTEAEDDAYKALAATMNTHLRALADKNYRSEIMAAYRETGRSSDARRVMSIMYVPHDGAMEKIAHADPDFVAKAARAEITIAGPSMLMALVGFARIEIDLGKQAENQEKIVEGAQALVESVAVAVEHAGQCRARAENGGQRLRQDGALDQWTPAAARPRDRADGCAFRP